MKPTLTSRSIFVAVLLLVCGVNVLAASFGAVDASPVVGQRLVFSAPLVGAMGDQATEGCVHADVSYGQAHVPAQQVRATVHSGAGGIRQVRVSSELPIDEPYVTVLLRAGCASPVAREYVLLAEAPGAPLITAIRRARLTGATVVGRTAVAAVAAPPKTASATGATAAWDTAPALLPASFLRVSSRLDSALDPNPAHRAAAAALWQALTAQPQDLLRSSERLQFLEAQMNTLREVSRSNRSELVGLQYVLGRTRVEIHQVMALAAALLLAAGASGGLLLYRSRRSPGGRMVDWAGGEVRDSFLDQDVVRENAAPLVATRIAAPGRRQNQLRLGHWTVPPSLRRKLAFAPKRQWERLKTTPPAFGWRRFMRRFSRPIFLHRWANREKRSRSLRTTCTARRRHARLPTSSCSESTKR
jgi:hypothetical protein